MDDNLKPKRVKVSKQRQISIPKEFYDELNFTDEAFVELSGNTLIIRPIRNEHTDLSEYILEDLISDGYTGDELLRKFKEIKNKLPEAIERMSQEALEGNLRISDVCDVVEYECEGAEELYTHKEVKKELNL